MSNQWIGPVATSIAAAARNTRTRLDVISVDGHNSCFRVFTCGGILDEVPDREHAEIRHALRGVRNFFFRHLPLYYTAILPSRLGFVFSPYLSI